MARWCLSWDQSGVWFPFCYPPGMTYTLCAVLFLHFYSTNLWNYRSLWCWCAWTCSRSGSSASRYLWFLSKTTSHRTTLGTGPSQCKQIRMSVPTRPSSRFLMTIGCRLAEWLVKWGGYWLWGAMGIYFVCCKFRKD